MGSLGIDQIDRAAPGVEPQPVGSFPYSGIDIIIVGTGLAGLTAAIECTRKGHNVRVLERGHTINTAGEAQSAQLSLTSLT